MSRNLAYILLLLFSVTLLPVHALSTTHQNDRSTTHQPPKCSIPNLPNDQSPNLPNDQSPKQLNDDFVLGVDMGWLTEMESKGWKCFDTLGNEREAMSLMADYGVKAERVRVWVDPSRHGGWCGEDDVLKKCLRAKALGQDIMIDFHYSDWWADPAKQNIPESWKGYSFKKMKKDLAQHTVRVLNLLKVNGVTPRWVQVGNETSHGMLWSVKMDPRTGWEWKDEKGNTKVVDKMAHLPEQPKRYAGFIRAGYDAVKSVFPETKVIVHLDNGFDNKLYNYNLDIIKKYGGKFDMIGMSVYPYWAMQSKREPTAEKTISDAVTNMRLLADKYGVDVMVTETGFEVDERHPEVMARGRDQLRSLIRQCRTLTNGHCRGVFYWEPQCSPRQYKLGAFTHDGRPTVIMNGFFEKDPEPLVVEPPIPDVIVDTQHPLYSYEDLLRDLRFMQRRYPDLVHVEMGDTTCQGRAIPIVRFGGKDAQYHIMVTGSIHAREYMSTQLVMAMMEQYARGYDTMNYGGTPFKEVFDSVALVILPMVNPDGVMIAQQGFLGAVTREAKLFVLDAEDRYDQIKSNANGVDINRNFGNGFGDGKIMRYTPNYYYYSGPRPYSEVETRQLVRTSRQHDYLCFLNYHSSGNVIYYGCMNACDSVNEDAHHLAALINAHTGYKMLGPDSSMPNGSWADEVELQYHRPSMTIEIGSRNPVPVEQFPSIFAKNRLVWVDLCRTLLEQLHAKEKAPLNVEEEPEDS